MARIPVSLKMDAGLVARIDARRMGSRSMWIEKACRAFLAHDEGCARELARVVERFRASEGLTDAECVVLDADSARVLARFGERARS